MRRTEARAGWSLAFAFTVLVGCGLEPNPSPYTDPTDGWSDAADVTDGTDGAWPGNDATDGGDGQADAMDGSDGVDGWTDGVDGSDGMEAADGADATDATDATDAGDGYDATDGWDGTDATDATDGNDATDGTDGLCPVPLPPGPLAQAPSDHIEVLESLTVPAHADLPYACAIFLGEGSLNERLSPVHAGDPAAAPVTLGPETGYGRIAFARTAQSATRVYATTAAAPDCSEPAVVEGPSVGCGYGVAGYAAPSPCDYGLVDTFIEVETATAQSTGPNRVVLTAPDGFWRLEMLSSLIVRSEEDAWLCAAVAADQLPELATRFCAASVTPSLCTALVLSTSCPLKEGCRVAFRANLLLADRLVLEESP